MKQSGILSINSSGRYQGSLTRLVSEKLVDELQKKSVGLAVTERDLAEGIPFVNEQWIGANFTDSEQRDETQKEALALSDNLVSELQNAEHIIIGSPIYNFSVPAVLKAWVDMVARARVTFQYTENGPEGLLKDKKAYLVMASGGVPIGSDMDIASIYLKRVLGFMGIIDVTVIDATKIDVSADRVLPA
ncbi:FMN-dependent NADH-azoreductase [Paraglaciecola arctica]|uniref:FMN-dependent NADH-azoreductase n=1 Tax=Paraglaciecola arctica TaxID=1128911 RepID=UPI001C06DC75|nr:NAD(P)H-dependent oxidoreductase [Paraglaciecola arctica]MBU3005904.1 NAD(P)H-dependent oxidoreductase [Paraglaciecola arctica]